MGWKYLAAMLAYKWVVRKPLNGAVEDSENKVDDNLVTVMDIFFKVKKEDE